MKKWSIFLLVLLIPLVISGCFGLFKKDQPEDENKVKQNGYIIYENLSLGEAVYKVKYPEKWKIKEVSTGRLATATDEVTLKVNKEQLISILAYQADQESNVLSFYNIETQTQTEVSRFLGTRIIGILKENKGEKEEAVLVINGDYLYVFKTTTPNSPEFAEFLNDITIVNNLTVTVTPVESLPSYKLYFYRSDDPEPDCQAHDYREVYISLPEEELALIPNVIKALLSPEKLELESLGLTTAIPQTTRLLSFGYDNNKAIVNFSSQLNKGGGSCEMGMRRSQIEKTLKALSEVSNLRIREVEIQVEGQLENVLQP